MAEPSERLDRIGLAAKLGVHPQTVDRAVKDRRLPKPRLHPIRRRPYWIWQEVEAYIRATNPDATWPVEAAS